MTTRQFKVHYLLILPVVLYLLYVSGIFYSENVSEASKIVLRKIHLFLIPLGFFVADKKITDHEFHTILIIFLVACIASSLFCYGHAVFNIIENKSIIYPSVYRQYYFSYIPLTEPLGITPIYLSMFANLALIIALKSPLISRRIFRISIVSYIGVFIILIAAKSGIITFIVILLILAINDAKRKAITFLTLSAFVVVLAFAIFNFPFLKERFITATTFDYAEENGLVWNSTTLRLAIWSSAIDAIRESPFFGYGPGDAQAALEDMYVKKGFAWGVYYKKQPDMTQYNPHNEFLSAELDVGIPGFVLLLLIFVTAFEYSLRSKNSVMTGFMMIILLSFMVESVLFRQKGIVFVTFFYSFIFWHYRNRQANF